MARLDSGQTFPTLEVPRTGGGTLRLPDEFAGHYGVVLIYRGSWCPYCTAQLAAFQRATDTLTALDVRVAALSVNDEPTTKALVDKHHLAFPVGHSADAEQVAALTGAYLNDDRRHLQSTGFVLGPDGSVLNAVYSSGAIGRLVPEDVAGLVRFLRSRA